MAWREGDVIVLASTDFDFEQAEKRTITAIDGNVITLDQPLEYMHFGEITFDVDQGTFDLAGNTHLAYADPTDTNSAQLETVIDDFTGYKNKNNAIWGRGENHVFRNLKLADNGIGYTHAFPGGEPGGADFTSKIVDSLFVGETDNTGNPRSEAEIAYGRSLPNQYADYPIRGFEYYDFTHHLENVTFRNFEDNATRNSGAISYLLFTNFGISTNNSVEGLVFENAKPVYFPEMDTRPLKGKTWTATKVR